MSLFIIICVLLFLSIWSPKALGIKVELRNNDSMKTKYFNATDNGEEKQHHIDSIEKSTAEVMRIMTVRMSLYLKWCGLCFAGVNSSLIRYRWDLWEEGMFSMCQVISHRAVSVSKLPLKHNPQRKHSDCWITLLLAHCMKWNFIAIYCPKSYQGPAFLQSNIFQIFFQQTLKELPLIFSVYMKEERAAKGDIVQRNQYFWVNWWMAFPSVTQAFVCLWLLIAKFSDHLINDGVFFSLIQLSDTLSGWVISGADWFCGT